MELLHMAHFMYERVEGINQGRASQHVRIERQLVGVILAIVLPLLAPEIASGIALALHDDKAPWKLAVKEGVVEIVVSFGQLTVYFFGVILLLCFGHWSRLLGFSRFNGETVHGAHVSLIHPEIRMWVSYPYNVRPLAYVDGCVICALRQCIGSSHCFVPSIASISTPYTQSAANVLTGSIILETP